MSDLTTEKFESWCLVELFGHQKIAGLCTEQNIAGTNMLRVDVPETKRHPPFTRLFGSSAIYALNPVDEKTARIYAESLSVSPIVVYEITEYIKKQDKLLLEKPVAANPGNGHGESEEHDDESKEFDL